MLNKNYSDAFTEIITHISETHSVMMIYGLTRPEQYAFLKKTIQEKQ